MNILTGAKLLAQQHIHCAIEEQYVRCVDDVTVGNTTFRIIVCMTLEMSKLLMNAKQLTFDTSFKHVHKWEEFEIEMWHDDAKRCKNEIIKTYSSV